MYAAIVRPPAINTQQHDSLFISADGHPTNKHFNQYGPGIVTVDS